MSSARTRSPLLGEACVAGTPRPRRAAPRCWDEHGHLFPEADQSVCRPKGLRAQPAFGRISGCRPR